MPNRIRGDAELVANGKRYTLRLTLGALAEIEDGLGIASLGEIGARLKTLATSDIAVVASALLRGGGHDLSADEVMALDVELGVIVRAIASAFANAGLDRNVSPPVNGPPSLSASAGQARHTCRGVAEGEAGGSTAEGGEGGGRSTSPLAGAASSPSGSA